MNSKTKEIVMYLVFGVLTTLVSWGTYALFVNTFGMSVMFGNILSWIFAVAFAFVTNKLWVFDSKQWGAKILIQELCSFIASRGITGVLEIVGVPLIAAAGFDTIFYSLLEKMSVNHSLLYTDGIYSKISVAIIVVILNYVLSKLLVFKKPSA